MLIHIKKGYKIVGKDIIYELLERFEFKKTSAGKSKIKITLFPKDLKIESQSQFDISITLFEFLKTGCYKGTSIFNDKGGVTNNIDINDLDVIFGEISKIQDALTKPTEEIIRFIQLFFNRSDIEHLIPDQDIFWSHDEIEWKNRRSSRPSERPYVYKPIVPLNDIFLPELQKCIDSKVEPFLAFDFLYQADKFGEDPRHKWINATIALELAIKEFLTRKDDRLISIFADLPSPRIDILYYSVLMEYNSEINPIIRRKDIQIASDIRNKLVHNPSEITIDEQTADTYVKIVKATVFQLFLNLYPDIKIFSFFSDKSVDNFSRELPYNQLEKMLESAKRKHKFVTKRIQEENVE